ncbi:hypothetical protein D3C86_1377890 [compost metagenome]
MHATQRDHAADRLVFADLEAGNGLLRLGNHGLLASDLGQVGDGVVEDLLVGDCFTHTHVQGDLGETRNLHRRLVAELFRQVFRDLFAIVLLETCHVSTS